MEEEQAQVLEEVLGSVGAVVSEDAHRREVLIEVVGFRVVTLEVVDEDGLGDRRFKDPQRFYIYYCPFLTMDTYSDVHVLCNLILI